MPIKNISYWALYLKKYLTEEDDPRKDDDAFIDARAELAAATMEEVVVTGTGLRSERKPNFVNFHADRPFAYMITEHSTGLILFMGVYDGK